MVQLAAHIFATYAAGPKTTTFTVADEVEEGDQLIAVLFSDDVDDAFSTAPAGWTALLSGGGALAPIDTGTYKVHFFQKVAEANDVGVSPVWTGAGAIAPEPSGVLLVLRDGVTGETLVTDVGTNPVAGEDIATDPASWSLPALSQSDDLALVVLWVVPATTVDDDGDLVELGQQLNAGSRIYLGQAPLSVTGLGAASGDDIALGAANNWVTVGLALRSKPVPRPVGAVDPVPGAIGLDL